ncbi:hypothetical protein [Geotoga petraea]|uniref:Uncharacterized protein n=1 Tax=Geotoga petraea TaxID=28234 RepID=A0A1G6K0P5_9BACT|nr:hypothetical protein [Geotoga petraea]MDK2945562.1 hypothetical protein [Geotoga sp.]TGG88381.1 hypothetical protein E4650_04885 [Geotoga petraea]SDC24478.1 hypothetical protein SAMN04488588_0695 [Geotoga petraea]
MKKFFISIYFIIIIFGFSYDVYSSDRFINKESKILKILDDLGYKKISMQVIETKTLNEFTQLTNLPYSYYNGALLVIDGKKYIIITPFKYFDNLLDVRKTVNHEILHYYLTEKTDLTSYEQEGVILYLLNDFKNEEGYSEYRKMDYYEIINYIKTRELY